MKLLQSYVLITCVLFSLDGVAAQKAQVILMRGKVTMLAPGANSAKTLKRGDWLLEDSSIVTSKKSFVKIKFEDKSTMNVGPDSKVVINKMPTKKANMVNLLTGIIKAEVQKNSPKETKNKMLIKTRSAVMGVRGTKFQSTFNPTNKRTALVTIEGKVAMAKQNIKPTIEPDSRAEELEAILDESDSAVEVEAGRFSGVGEEKVASDIVTKPTVPVKIAPEQYNAIAKTMDSSFKAEDVMAQKESDIAPEGFENLKEGVIAPKAGGYVDFNSGLYIAPLKEAIIDEKTGTYTAKNVGTVDQISGDYIPPKGVKVDAKKGLVIDNKELAKLTSLEDQRSVAATIAQVNKEVEKQGLDVNKIQNKKSKKSISKWLPKNHLIAVEFLPYSESLKVKNKGSGSSADFYSDSASWVNLSWKQVWSEKIFSQVVLGFQEYEVKVDDFRLEEYGGEDDADSKVSLGFGYNYSKFLVLKAGVVFRDDYYLKPEGIDGDGAKRVSIRNGSSDFLYFGASYNIYKLAGFDIILDGDLHLGESNTPTFGDGNEKGELFGLSVGLSSFYEFTKKLGAVGFVQFTGESVEASDFEYERDSLGLGVNLIYDI